MRTPDTESATTARRAAALAFAACFVAVAVLVALPAPARAAGTPPWFGPNVKVNVPPAYSGYQPSIAVGTNGVAYLAFAGWGGSATGQDIFFAKSTNGGRTWTAPLRVNNDAGGAFQADPFLTLDSASNIYIAWTDYRSGGADVFFSKSTDGGLSFSSNVRVNDVIPQAQFDPAVAVDSVGLIHVVWTDSRNAFTTGPDIFYGNSTDGGLSFNPNLRINNDATATEQGRPTIAVAADHSVYIAWDDPRNGGRGRDIFFSKSTDRGNTWTPNILVNDDTGAATQIEPVIAVNPAGAIFLAWTDYRTANTAPDIYASRSTNAGASFAANAKVNDDASAAFQGMPAIAARPGQVVVGWADGRTYGGSWYDVYWASSPDGLTWGASSKANDDAGLAQQYTPTVAFDAAGDVFAAWFDGRSGGQDVFAATLDVVAPVAIPGADVTIAQGAFASFDGSASLDNLGIASYAWNFGDGAMATGVSGSHVYDRPGVYSATLTVWDYSGNANSASLRVTVADTRAPVVLGVGNRTVDEGQPLFFDASASTDNVGVSSWSWDFGDGTTATGPTATHVYVALGTYTATVRVLDAAGNTATATMTITVRPVAPKASELLGMIQVLDLIVVILAILLTIVGYMAYTLWRRSRGGPGASYMPPATPPANPPRAQDPLDIPPPPSGPPGST